MSIVGDIESSLKELSKLKNDAFQAIDTTLESISRPELLSEEIPNGRESINGVQARLSGFYSLTENVIGESFDSNLVS